MIVIQTTSNSKKVLKNIAKELLNKRLTACTHISKISYSSYIWKDEVVSQKEYKLEIKTIEKHEKAIVSFIKEDHNYEIFELSKNKTTNLNPDYLKWFKEQIK